MTNPLFKDSKKNGEKRKEKKRKKKKRRNNTVKYNTQISIYDLTTALLN